MRDVAKCTRCQALNAWNPAKYYGEVLVKGASRTIQALYSVGTDDGNHHIAVMNCGGCGGQFVAYRDYRGEVSTLWPLAAPSTPEGVDEKVAEAYKDARLALSVGSMIGALMAGRTVLIRMLRDKKASSFKDLVENGTMTPALYRGADQLRLWADIVGHEDVEVNPLEAQDIEDVLDYLGTVLEAVYTHQFKVNKLVAKTKELKGGRDAK